MTAAFARGRPLGTAGRALLALHALVADPPRAAAGNIKQSVWEYSIKYPSDKDGTATSEYARVTVDGLTKEGFDAAKSSAYIVRPAIGGPLPFVILNVPMKLYQSAQTNVKPGLIDIRFPRDPKNPAVAVPTFRPGDTVFFRVVLAPGAVPVKNARFGVPNLLWRDGDGGANGNSTVATTKMVGGKFVADPVYAATNDLSSSDYPVTSFNVRNLSFISNVSESAFLGPTPEQEALDLLAASLAPADPLKPAFGLSSGQEKMYTDPFAEPDVGNYSGAAGQLVDADGTVIGAFKHGYSVVPEPGAWAWLGGGAAWATGVYWRVRRRAARPGGTP